MREVKDVFKRLNKACVIKEPILVKDPCTSPLQDTWTQGDMVKFCTIILGNALGYIYHD
jgi:hypothetical protein